MDKPDRMPNVPPFVKFVASAVPMVFDNSLSYYEALCALWKYIQGMTDVINNNATLEEEYIVKFNELKTFVDDYFANLDVQEEINNKLDQMAEDGTLQEIITAYIQANVAWAFDTVADMQSSTNLVNGSYAQTLGYHTLNDGGGALYKITNTGTADGGNTIAIGNLYAHLVKTSPNVKQYGAYGDGSHDDTNAVQLAIDSNTGKVLIFPEGSYITSDSIRIDSNISIKGYNAKIVPDSSVLDGVIVGNNVTPINVDIDSLEVVRSEYDGTTENTGYKFLALYESNLSNLVSENSKYNYFFNPSSTKGFAYNVLTNLAARRGYINLYISADTANGGYCNENVFIGGRMFTGDNTQYNVKIDNGGQNRFYCMCCEGSGVNAIYCDGKENVFEYPRTEGTWSNGGYGVVFGSSSEDNRLFGLRYDLHLQDNGNNNTYWNQYDGMKVATKRIAGRVASFTRSSASSTNDGEPIVSIEDQGTSGTTTVLKIVEKDTNINHRPIRVLTKSGVDKFYIDGYGQTYVTSSLNVIDIKGHILPIKIGNSGLYYKNNILWSTYLGDKTDAVPVGHDYKTYAGDPNNHVIPQYIGQECLDTTNNAWYKATSLTNSSWAKLTA